MDNKCSAFVNGICTNGFFGFSAVCDPIKPVATCPTCRQPYKRQPTPPCLREDVLPPPWERVESARRGAGLST